MPQSPMAFWHFDPCDPGEGDPSGACLGRAQHTRQSGLNRLTETRLRSSTRPTSLPPGWGTPEYPEAATQAAVYFASRAGNTDLGTLISQVCEFRALTFEVVRWLYEQRDNNRNQMPKSSA